MTLLLAAEVYIWGAIKYIHIFYLVVSRCGDLPGEEWLFQATNLERVMQPRHSVGKPIDLSAAMVMIMGSKDLATYIRRGG